MARAISSAVRSPGCHLGPRCHGRVLAVVRRVLTVMRRVLAVVRPEPARCAVAPVRSRRKITCMVSVATAAIMRLCVNSAGYRVDLPPQYGGNPHDGVIGGGGARNAGRMSLRRRL